eukprot:325279-Rhodomonas_salina.3
MQVAEANKEEAAYLASIAGKKEQLSKNTQALHWGRGYLDPGHGQGNFLGGPTPSGAWDLLEGRRLEGRIEAGRQGV